PEVLIDHHRRLLLLNDCDRDLLLLNGCEGSRGGGTRCISLPNGTSTRASSNGSSSSATFRAFSGRRGRHRNPHRPRSSSWANPAESACGECTPVWRHAPAVSPHWDLLPPAWKHQEQATGHHCPGWNR